MIRTVAPQKGLSGRRVAVLVALGLAFWVSAQPCGAQDDAPLAPELLAARTIFVRQTLIDPKIVSRFRSEIAKWERLEVVISEDDADIVATLSAEIGDTETVADAAGAADGGSPSGSGRAGDSAPPPQGTVGVQEDIQLTITMADGTEIWKDAVSAGSLTGNASRKLAKRLRTRIEAEDKEEES